MIIGIIGSRTFRDYTIMHNKFQSLIEQYGNSIEIITGGAKGVDSIAEHEATIRWLKLRVIKPDFSNGYDVRQYHFRNDKIIFLSDMIVAFWDGKSKGTKSVIDKCRTINKPIEVIHF